jgi:hypothetical protein
MTHSLSRRLTLQVGDFDAECLSERARGTHQGRVASLNTGDRRSADTNAFGELGLSNAALDAPVDQRRQGDGRRGGRARRPTAAG